MNKPISYILAVVMMVVVSCGNDKNDAIPDAQALLTSGIWKMKTVTIDGVNKNDLYTNFTVSFTATEFAAINGAPVWPASGTWTFVSSDQKTFTRNDGAVVTLVDISESELTLKLTWAKTTLGRGRAVSIQGIHTFVFSK